MGMSDLGIATTGDEHPARHTQVGHPGESGLQPSKDELAVTLQPIHALAIVDRLEGGREAIEAQLPLTALYTRKDFLS